MVVLAEGVPMTEACQNCKFFQFLKHFDDEEVSDQSKGYCRRMPPVPLEAMKEGYCYSMQGETVGREWCGEWVKGKPAFYKRR